MIRMHAKRLLAVAFLVLLALGSVACNATVGVGVGVPIYGGWGPHGHWGPGAYGGIYVGGSIWP